MSTIPPITLSYIKEKWSHVGFQKYLQNTGWMFFGRFFILGVSFFMGIYIARYLGPSNYGLLAYVTSFVGLFSFLASFGIDSIVSREIIKDHSKKDELIGTAFYIKIIGSFIAIATVFIVSLFTTKDLFTLGLIWVFSLTFIPQAFNIIDIYFQSQVLSKKTVIAQITANIISTLLKILVIILGKGIFWLTVIFIIEASVYAFILLYSFRKIGNHIRDWKFNTVVAKSLLKDSWPLILSGISFLLYVKIDQVMIKNMLGNEQAGIYAVAVKLSEVWYLIPVIVCTSLFPSIVQSMTTSKELFEKRMKKLYSLMIWPLFAIAAFITIFAYPIIKILFGMAYIESVTSLRIYVWAGIFISLSIAIGQYLVASNLTKISFYNNLVGAITNIMLNILLIPKIGIRGAAIATVISYATATFAVFLFKDSRAQGFLVLKAVLFWK